MESGLLTVTVMPHLRGRILVVDDDPDLRGVIVSVLKDEGYGAVEAANGNEAMCLLREDASFSLILLDLVMPVMDGWRFREAQAADSTLASIPVVTMSTDGSNAVRRPPPAAAYLEKPFRLALLSTTIRNCVRGAPPEEMLA